jgi:hypothetical protein
MKLISGRLHQHSLWYLLLASRGQHRAKWVLQNGHSYKAKQKLVDKKENAGLVGTIKKTDIVRLVSFAWDQLFTRVACNQKAIAKHGWGPWNYNILLHPDINLD